MRKIPFAGIELTSNVSEGYKVTSGLPGQVVQSISILNDESVCIV